MSVRIFEPKSDDHWSQARRLIGEYALSLHLDLSFQQFAHELEHLSVEYGPPTGSFFLAEDQSSYLGCVGLRQYSLGVGEIKRLYIRPSARGQGIGRRLAETAVAAGKHLGYTRLLLDTLPNMIEAQSLYLSLGFKPTDAYRFNPVLGTVFLELALPER